MESSSRSDVEADSRPTAMQRGGSDGKIQRLADHTQGLVDDLKTWVDLRIELARIEIEERIEKQANQVALGILMAGLGLLAVVFGLSALALGLGAWLGHPAWGFLAVTGLLVLLVVLLRAAQPELVDVDLRSKHGPPGDKPTADRSRADSA